MSAAELDLRDALEEWREARTLERYGWAHLNDLGPTLIMPLDVLDSIVDSAHYSKIHTTDDLAKETQWDEVDRYGDEIVALISRICPQPSVQTSLATAPPLLVSSIHSLDTKPDPRSSINTELEPTAPAKEKN